MAILFKMCTGEWGGGGGGGDCGGGQFPKKMVKITPKLGKMWQDYTSYNASRRWELEDGA